VILYCKYYPTPGARMETCQFKRGDYDALCTVHFPAGEGAPCDDRDDSYFPRYTLKAIYDTCELTIEGVQTSDGGQWTCFGKDNTLYEGDQEYLQLHVL